MDDRTNGIDETTQDDAGSSLGGGINLEDGCGEDGKLDDTTRPDEADQTSEPFPDEEAGDDLGSSDEGEEASDGGLEPLEVELIVQGNAAIVAGGDVAVQDFLKSLAVPERKRVKLQSKSLGRLRDQMKNTGTVAQGLSEIAEGSGYYIKLTKESAALRKEHGLYETAGGITYAKIANFEKPGKPGKWLKVDESLGAQFANPAVLSGLGGLMTQAALEQALSEIASYLKRIDTKLVDISDTINDANVSNLIGVHTAIQKEIRRRDSGIRVDQDMWSKVSSYGDKLSGPQDNALRRIGAISKKLTACISISEANSALDSAMSDVRNWLVVLVHVRQAELWLDELELEYRSNENSADYGKYVDSVRKEQIESLAKTNQGLDNLLDSIDYVINLANRRMVLDRSNAEKAIPKAKWIEDRVWDLKTILDDDSERRSIEVRELSRGEALLSQAAPFAPVVAGVAFAAVGQVALKKTNLGSLVPRPKPFKF